MPSVLYEVNIVLDPTVGVEYDSTIYKRASADCLAAARAKFGKEAVAVEPYRFPNLPPEPYFTHVVVTTAKKQLCFDINRWTQAEGQAVVGAVIKLSSGLGIVNARSGRTVVHARWVDLWGSLANIARSTYAVCRKCGCARVDDPPNPLRVIAGVSNSGTEIYRLDNSLYVVSRRVHELFDRYASDEFYSGDVAIEGKRGTSKDFRWIRPRNHLDGLAVWFETKHCSGCGAAHGWERRCDDYPDCGQLLRTFGPKELNMARLSRWGHRLRAGYIPSENAVISGGLFGVLYNSRVKGLFWPANGPYISVQSDDVEPTLEVRRCADTVGAGEDRALKYEPKSVAL